MQVIVLLGGRSVRFWPLTEKALFPIAGKTILEHQVARLRAAGLNDITFVGGVHNIDALRSVFPKAKAVVQRETDPGMHGALLAALPAMKDKPVLIVSSNDVVLPSAYKAVTSALKHGIDGVLLAKTVTRYFPGGYLTLSGKQIVGIAEKPGEGNEPSNLVNLVVHAHRSASTLLKALEGTRSEKDDAYERALDGLFQAHHYVAAPYDGAWLPVKYPWQLLPLLAHLLDTTVTKRQIHRSAKIHKTAVIEGPVIIEEGAEVLPNACIRGPAYIGKRTIVANNALVRGSSVGNDSVVGFCTEIKASVCHSHLWTHMTYVGDSVIGENVSFGAGAVTGNLRLDEEEIHSGHGEFKVATGLTKFGAVIGDDCRFGIHSALNPGIKVGRGSFVSSGTLVSKDVPERSFVRMKNGEMAVNDNKISTPKPAARTAFKAAVAGAKSTKKARR